MFGSQFLVIGLDFKENKKKYKCYYNRGKSEIKLHLNKYLDKINKISRSGILVNQLIETELLEVLICRY